MDFFANKKGNAVIETVTIMVIMFVLAVVCVAGYVILKGVNTQMNLHTTVNSSQYIITNNATARYPTLFDSIFLFIFIAAWINAIIASFLLDTHPIYFALSLLLLVAVMISSVYISNYFETLINTTPDYLTASTSFPMMMFIMTHLLEMTIAMALSISVALFAKSRL